MHRKDFFLSYAGEDERVVAKPLEAALRGLGFDIWYAPRELEPGDSLRQRIDDGLAKCRFGVVILSQNFFQKEWPKYELDGLTQLQMHGFTRIVPVWHNVDSAYVTRFSPSLAGIVALQTSDGIRALARRLAAHARVAEEPKLTPEEPQEDTVHYEEWLRYTSECSTRLEALIGRECAWAYRLEAGIPINDVELVYIRNPGLQRYDRFMPRLVLRALESWEASAPNEKNKLSKEAWGTQVRLQGVEIPHGSYKLTLRLSPTKFLYYRAVQSRLWERALHPLRNFAFENSLNALNNGEPFLLPSNFAIHMGVVSSDGSALLRQRTAFTPLYPSAWEAGVGEFMHGPRQKRFQHFDKRGRPRLSLFLQKAVEEELKYDGAKPSDFTVFGFAIEYRTLAPKLLVVYQSDADIKTLLNGARTAKDRSPAVEAIKFVPKFLVKAMFDSERFPTWGPTSKLILSIALLQTAKSEVQRRAMVEEMKRLMPRRT